MIGERPVLDTVRTRDVIRTNNMRRTREYGMVVFYTKADPRDIYKARREASSKGRRNRQDSHTVLIYQPNSPLYPITTLKSNEPDSTCFRRSPPGTWCSQVLQVSITTFSQLECDVVPKTNSDCQASWHLRFYAAATEQARNQISLTVSSSAPVATADQDPNAPPYFVTSPHVRTPLSAKTPLRSVVQSVL